VIHHALWGALADAVECPEKPKILAGLLETDPECVNVGNPGTMLEHRATVDNNTPLQTLCKMDSAPHPSYGAPDPASLVACCEYLISQKADFQSPDGEGLPPRRRVRSDLMRKEFNQAKYISSPGAPPKFKS
jgi:hypothetical protein